MPFYYNVLFEVYLRDPERQLERSDHGGGHTRRHAHGPVSEPRPHNRSVGGSTNTLIVSIPRPHNRSVGGSTNTPMFSKPRTYNRSFGGSTGTLIVLTIGRLEGQRTYSFKLPEKIQITNYVKNKIFFKSGTI